MTNPHPSPDRVEELTLRAKALLEAGVSPWPWKVAPHGGGLRTVDDEYLAESMGWSSPRGGEIRDRDLEMASLAPQLAHALLSESESVTVMRTARDALQAMMDAWFDYHDSHSLTQPVTGAAGGAFEKALAARDVIDAKLSHGSVVPNE